MRFSKFRLCLTCICLCLTLLFPRAAWVVITFCCGHARKPRCQFLNWRRFCCDSVVRFCFWHRAPPHQCYVHRGRRVSQGCQGGHQSSCNAHHHRHLRRHRHRHSDQWPSMCIISYRAMLIISAILVSSSPSSSPGDDVGGNDEGLWLFDRPFHLSRA